MTISSASDSSSSAPLVVNGLVSGIDTSAVISALLQAYQEPITNLQNEQSSLNALASDYQTLASDMQQVASAAGALDTASDWDLMSATTSNSAVATATASAGAQSGSLSFEVTQLAQANVLLSEGGVSSESSSVTSVPAFLVATGGAAIGFSSLGSSDLSIGSHSIEVTQSSSAASLTGAGLGATTTITTGSNDTLDLTVNGTSYALTLAAGSYTPGQLAAEVNAAAGSAGAPITASVNAAGELGLATNEQGSEATLSVTGGDGAGALGLGEATATGTDAVVSVDGTATTLSAVTAGGEVTLDAPGGSITATVAQSPSTSGALISAGTASAAELSSGTGTLGAIVQAINGSGLGVTATAIDSDGAYRLQVGANSTGLAGSVSVDPGAFGAGGLVALSTISAAQDAEVSVGGDGGYSLSSATDTFSSLMSGTDVTVSGLGSATVSVVPDAQSSASAVGALVSAANQALTDINSLTAYDSATKSGGPLMGSPTVDTLRDEILSVFASATGTSTLGNAQDVGISVGSNGTVSFNETEFEDAFANDPDGVAAMFTQGGTYRAAAPASAGEVSLTYAGENTAAGSYAVVLDQSGEQAIDTGNVLPGATVSVPEELSISSGEASATFQTTAGESLSSIADGLNAAFAANGLALSAAVSSSGDQLQLTSDEYGSATSFSVTSDATGAGTTGLGGATVDEAASFSGTDVAGTIGGVTATGTGQVLAAPDDDETLDGLSLLVTTPGVSSATPIGTFTYSPGIAQQLATIAQQMTATNVGDLTTQVAGLQSEATGLNSRISNYEQLETEQQATLQNEYATMESTLGSLKDESSSISSELSGITANEP